MRAAQPWDGYRSRISKLDSSGAGIVTSADTLVPSVIVGFDEADSAPLLLGGAQSISGVGAFVTVGVHAFERDAWCEAFVFELIAGSVSRPRVELAIFDALAPAPTPFGFGIWHRQPNVVRAVQWPAGPAGVAWDPLDVTVARCGLVIPKGNVLLFGVSDPGQSFRIHFAIRET